MFNLFSQSSIVLCLALTLCATSSAFAQSLIPRSSWQIQFVDSQETQGENGAATNVFDGNPGTFWHTQWYGASPSAPHEIQINLGGTYSVAGLRYLARQDMENGRLADYQFYVSTDGVNWGTPIASGAFQNTSSEQQRLFAGKSGRFVRLVALSEVNGNPWSSIAELNLLASTTVTTNQPPDGQITAPPSDVTITQGQSVTFGANGTDPEGTSLTYAWSFGTGGPAASTARNPGAITFNAAGVYQVTMMVTDAGGASDPTPATRVITVQSNAPPPSGGSAVVISKAGWRLRFVDSQELQGENGAAVNAFDGDNNTIWHTSWLNSNPPPPHEIQIDLGATYSVSGFRHLPRQGNANGHIAQYQFFVSADGQNWGTAVSAGVFPNTSDETEYRFTPKSGRFISLRALSEVNGNPWTSLAELNVLASGSGGSGQAPQVTWTTSISGVVDAGTSLTLRVNASDPDGVIAGVDFFANSQPIGSDAAAPYQIQTGNLQAGTYAFVAVATDNSGNSTTSSPLTVQVGTPNIPRTAVFEPSSDHSTVTRYVLEIFRAGADPASATPVLTRNLGVPPINGNVCSVDVADAIMSLGSGFYFGTVSAENAAGRARSSPSALFSIP